MTRILMSSLLALACLVLVSCEKTPTNTGYALAPTEVEDLLKKSDAGSTQASYRLFQYYGTTQNRAKALFYLERAAKEGDPLAQYNLSIFLSTSDDPKEREAAAKWAEMAKKSGDPRFF